MKNKSRTLIEGVRFLLFRQKMEPRSGLEPETSSLPWKYCCKYEPCSIFVYTGAPTARGAPFVISIEALPI